MKFTIKIKNKAFKLLVLQLVCIAIFASCKKLDEVKPGMTDPKSYLETMDDANSLLVGVYGVMYGDNGYGKKGIIILDMGSDEMGVGGTFEFQDRTGYDRFSYFNPSWDDFGRWWYTQYLAVGRAGFAIDVIKQMGGLTESQQKLQKQYIAEARFLRALAYFNLIRLWGDVPFFGDRAIDVSIDAETTRTPVETVYNFIINELKRAMPNLLVRASKSDQTNKGRVTKGAAQTLLAKIYLTRAGWRLDAVKNEMVQGDQVYWDSAAAVCDDIINDPLRPYDLRPNYREVFPAGNTDPRQEIDGEVPPEQAGWEYNEEHIYLLDCQADHNPWGTLMSYGPRFYMCVHVSHYIGEPYIYYLFDSADKRLETTFIDTFAIRVGIDVPTIDTIISAWDTAFFTYPYPHIGKFLQEDTTHYIPPSRNPSGTDIVIFRYAEVLLMHAEAENEANGGPTAAGIASFNLIRQRAGLSNWEDGVLNAESGTNFTNDQDGFRKAIRQERIFELCFERKRKYDLLRWGIYEQRFKDLAEMSEAKIQDKERAKNIRKKHNLLPIPQRELNTNPNITQNPGY